MHRKYPNIRILAVSMYDNDPYVSDAIENGALGYLSKRHVSDELIQAIEHIYNDEIFYSNDVAANIQRNQLSKTTSHLRSF